MPANKPLLKVKKPWGNYQLIWKEKDFYIKIIEVAAGHRLSMQSHKFREEVWIPVNSELFIEGEYPPKKMLKGERYYIRKEEKHRLSSRKKKGNIIEIGFGRQDETDIIRYEDDYNRQGKTN